MSINENLFSCNVQDATESLALFLNGVSASHVSYVADRPGRFFAYSHRIKLHHRDRHVDHHCRNQEFTIRVMVFH